MSSEVVRCPYCGYWMYQDAIVRPADYCRHEVLTPCDQGDFYAAFSPAYLAGIAPLMGEDAALKVSDGIAQAVLPMATVTRSHSVPVPGFSEQDNQS